MIKIILLVLLALTLVSCGSSSSTAKSANTDYANTFTDEELNAVESAYKAAFAVYQAQVIQIMTLHLNIEFIYQRLIISLLLRKIVHQ